MPPNYQNGKIYKIYSYENDDVYYGSTVETLSRRMGHHKNAYKRYKEGNYHYVTSFNILEYDSSIIELVENYPCNNKEELLQREGYYIRNNNCINKQIAGRTRKECSKEYHQQNKEQLNKNKKEYYKQNKEQILQRQKEYYEINKEEIKEKKVEYRIINRDKLNKQKKEYRDNNKDKNKEYREQNKEQLKIYQKEYLIKNCDLLKEKRREYRQRKKEQALMLKEDTNINI